MQLQIHYKYSNNYLINKLFFWRNMKLSFNTEEIAEAQAKTTNVQTRLSETEANMLDNLQNYFNIASQSKLIRMLIRAAFKQNIKSN